MERRIGVYLESTGCATPPPRSTQTPPPPFNSTPPPRPSPTNPLHPLPSFSSTPSPLPDLTVPSPPPSQFYSSAKTKPDLRRGSHGILASHVTAHPRGGWCIARHFNDLLRELPRSVGGVNVDSVLKEQLHAIATLDRCSTKMGDGIGVAGTKRSETERAP